MDTVWLRHSHLRERIGWPSDLSGRPQPLKMRVSGNNPPESMIYYQLRQFQRKPRALGIPKRCEAANIYGSIAYYAKDRLKQAKKT